MANIYIVFFSYCFSTNSLYCQELYLANYYFIYSFIDKLKCYLKVRFGTLDRCIPITMLIFYILLIYIKINYIITIILEHFLFKIDFYLFNKSVTYTYIKI